jgi:hypothetical protein
MKRLIPIIALLLIVAAACVTEFDAKPGLSSFAVRVGSGPTGAVDTPVPFPDEPITYRLQIRALDADGDFMPSYEGKVAVNIAPVGRLTPGQPSRYFVENGRLDGLEVTVEATHGNVTIWVEDAGGLTVDGSYAVGATQPLHFANPTIAQIQHGRDYESSALSGDYVNVRVDDREVVVTNVRRDGYYCQDLTEEGGSYGGMFVFNFNRPYVNEGDIVTTLRGQVDEFFGFTELGFPDFLVESGGTVPEPAIIQAGHLADDNAMEALESSLVAVENVTVCPVDAGYYAYDQWRVTFGDIDTCDDEENTAVILIGETSVFDNLDPIALEGQTLERITGNLRYHYLADPSWIIVPRRAADFE